MTTTPTAVGVDEGSSRAMKGGTASPKSEGPCKSEGSAS